MDTPAATFTTVWRACVPRGLAARLVAEPGASVNANDAARLAAEWLAGPWTNLWAELCPIENPVEAASRDAWMLLRRFPDSGQDHLPAVYDALRDAANRAVSQTGFTAATALLADVPPAIRADAHARAFLAALGPDYDPWRPTDFDNYAQRYGALLALALQRLTGPIEKGYRLAADLGRSLAG